MSEEDQVQYPQSKFYCVRCQDWFETYWIPNWNLCPECYEVLREKGKLETYKAGDSD